MTVRLESTRDRWRRLLAPDDGLDYRRRVRVIWKLSDGRERLQAWPRIKGKVIVWRRSQDSKYEQG